MREDEVLGDLLHNQLLAYARFMRTQRVDPASSGGDMTAQIEVEALNQRGIHLLAIENQHRGDRLQGADNGRGA